MKRVSATLLSIAIVTACSGPAQPQGPSTTPSVTTSSTAVPPSVAPTAFPTGAFAGLGKDAMPEAVAAKFQSILATAVNTAGAGGMTATVITAEGTWSGAAGKADDVDDMQVESQFGIASGTKPIVAAQVMLMVQAGEISLDRPATDYLPVDFTFDTNGATIRQLLSHRSGIPDWYSDSVEARVMADRSHVWELDELLELVGSVRNPAGVAHEYADTNYNLLGQVIEHVTKRPLVDVLRDGALRVDGTERLIYQPDEAPTAPMAMPRGEPRTALEQGAGFLPSLSEASSCGPACAMASDSLSLARWWQAFCAGEIVSQASLTEMATFYDGPDEYGLGLFNPVEGRALAVGHLGASFGYISAAGCVTEQPVIFVVLTNQRTGHGPDLAVPLLAEALSD